MLMAVPCPQQSFVFAEVQCFVLTLSCGRLLARFEWLISLPVQPQMAFQNKCHPDEALFQLSDTQHELVHLHKDTLSVVNVITFSSLEWICLHLFDPLSAFTKNQHCMSNLVIT